MSATQSKPAKAIIATRRGSHPADGLPPHDIGAEQGVLGCILIAADGFAEARERITARSFFDLRHQAIFLGCADLHHAGSAIDMTLLFSWLKENKRLEDAGGIAYISSLPDCTPSAINLVYYLDIICEKQRLRELAEHCRSIHEAARKPGANIEEITDSLQIAFDEFTASHSRNGAAKQLPDIIDAASFIQDQIEKPGELVAGILHQGSKLVVGGGSKTFKTWALIDLALAVATGEPWLSFKTRQGRAAILNFEIQAPFFQQRIRAVMEAKQITLAHGMLDVWNLRGQACGYSSIFPRIIERVKSAGYALIILDPIYKCYGDVDENSAGAVAGLMNAIEAMAVKTGAAVAFGAHYSKGNQAQKESIDRISGSGVFARDPDSIINFTRHEEEDAFTVESTLRNFPPVEPFAVRWIYPLMRRDESLDPSKLKKSGGRKPEHDAGDLLALLPENGSANKDWVKTAQEQRGISPRTFYRLRSQLEKSDRIILSKLNEKWMPVKQK